MDMPPPPLSPLHGEEAGLIGGEATIDREAGEMTSDIMPSSSDDSAETFDGEAGGERKFVIRLSADFMACRCATHGCR
jgi:hypothetical protein